MTVWFNINPHSGIPIYMQLIEQVKQMLEVGGLQPGDQLPTVRDIAHTLSVAPNTVVRAYNELQRMGLIESRQGKGTVVVGDASMAIHLQRVEALYERLHVLVRDAAQLELNKDALRASFEREIERFFPSE